MASHLLHHHARPHFPHISRLHCLRELGVNLCWEAFIRSKKESGPVERTPKYSKKKRCIGQLQNSYVQAQDGLVELNNTLRLSLASELGGAFICSKKKNRPVGCKKKRNKRTKKKSCFSQLQNSCIQAQGGHVLGKNYPPYHGRDGAGGQCKYCPILKRSTLRCSTAVQQQHPLSHSSYEFRHVGAIISYWPHI